MFVASYIGNVVDSSASESCNIMQGCNNIIIIMCSIFFFACPFNSFLLYYVKCFTIKIIYYYCMEEENYMYDTVCTQIFHVKCLHVPQKGRS